MASDEVVKIHFAQLHIEEILFIRIDPSVVENADDVGMSAIATEFHDNSDFVIDGCVNFGLIDTNRPYEFSSKELVVNEGK
jgi:hypothetical protein